MGNGLDFKKALDPLGLFTKPDVPKVDAAPVSPSADATSLAAQDTAAIAAAQRAAAGGRASTVLTGDLGEADKPKTATKRLLGD